MDAKKEALITAGKKMLAAFSNCGSPRQQDAAAALQNAIDEATQPRSEDEQQFFDAAKSGHEVEGEVEFDTDAVVSISGDGGAYIQAWVYVEL